MLLPEFKKLRKKPDHAVGLPDLLNYAAFVAPSTILMKDGALLAGFAYVGPDLNSSESGRTRVANPAREFGAGPLW